MSDLHEGGTVVGGLASRGPRQAVAAREGAGAGGVLTHQDAGADGQAGEVVVLARLTRVVGLQACRERSERKSPRDIPVSLCRVDRDCGLLVGILSELPDIYRYGFTFRISTSDITLTFILFRKTS